ncbi:hypothetical protein N0V93_003490 [Gnomoniopsis smithogilvyi]|uniref:Uncharacterized protein n=1 Tax=Gnomoniopsis smithogilvyi TaxID=1191159 RepID=A0A9W9D034_9PEZI|nr:hypothetical protein N0V93_003490 [Gnomoniopsis smithogilvyi]
MHSFSLLPITALVLGTTAATVPRQSDPHIVDFRTYGVAGCFDENQGVYTYLQSDENICRTFVDSQIGSIFTLDITDGCFLYAYTDTACTEDQITVPVGIENCYNSTAAGLSSYEIVCTS